MIGCPYEYETPSSFLKNPLVVNVQERCHGIELVTNWLGGQGANMYMQYVLINWHTVSLYG